MSERDEPELHGKGLARRRWEALWRWLERVIDAHAIAVQGDGDRCVIGTPDPDSGFTLVASESTRSAHAPEVRRLRP